MTRINVADDHILYCPVSDNASEWADIYENSEECYNDLATTIEDYCKQREYNEIETERVLNHYRIKIENWPGNWVG